MLRFATSPTHDMNINDLRIALLNYIISKQKNEDFIIRIEDVDKEQSIEGKDKEILDILGVFGLEYSQVIYQSESVRFHTAMALQLMHEKKAFSCFCSDEWLEKKHKEAITANKPYVYDDACRNLPDELVIDNTSPFTIRVKKPINAKDIDSFVIMNQNKVPTHNFASAVDDMLNDISIVICNEDKMNNTQKQDLIRESLAYDKKIQYASLPIILNSMNKDISLIHLLKEGFLPQAIVNYLISSGSETPKEIFSLSEAIDWFDLDKISKSSSNFDINILRDINKKHLNNLEDKELSRYVGFADEEIGRLAKVYLENVSTTKELKSKIGAIFAPKEIPQDLKEDAANITEVIKNAPFFKEYFDFEEHILLTSKLNDAKTLKTLRFLLTGADTGPDIAKIYKYLKNYIGEIIK